MKDIFAFCLRRSGHTAISNWIGAALQPSHSLKDCNMSGGKLSAPVVQIIENDELKSEIYREGCGRQYDDKEQRYEYLKDYKLLLTAFEDSNHIDFNTGCIRDIVKRYAIIDNPKIVVVVRDPFNLFASRIWRNRESNEVPYNDRAAGWYNVQLRQWRTEEDFLFIDYAGWVINKTYRRYLAKKLDLPFTDTFHNRQANISSFNDFDHKAVVNGFFERWCQFLAKASKKQKKEYLKLLNNIDMRLVGAFFHTSIVSLG